MLKFKEFFYNSARKANENEVVYMYQHGMEINELEQESGRSRGDIYRILQRNQIIPARLRQKHHLVDYFHSAGYSPTEIAREIGMTPQGVRYIINNK